MMGIASGVAVSAPAPEVAPSVMPPALFGALHWRFIGPYRGGRTDAVAGIPGNLAVAYIGTVDGGVFKTIDAGRTWQ
ncbi:MAG TPA: hypothetical protein VF292_13740, partial [Rhodanobacteraceae bacterium]